MPIDSGVLHTAPHQRTILPHELLSPSPAMRASLQQTLEQSLLKLQSVWSEDAHAYVPWQNTDMARPPSQYIAFQQLQFRFNDGVPIAVCLVAPAGFGKSELLAAWRSYATLQGTPWDAVAPTGVAASQVGGTTPPPSKSKNTFGAALLPSPGLTNTEIECWQQDAFAL